jgi:hypothetical protein
MIMEAIIFSLVLTAFVMGAAYLLYRVQRWAETGKVTSPTQTEWDGDQLLVMSMTGLEAGKYRMDDTLYIRTERIGKVIEFRISVWAPLFEEMHTGQLNVLNVKLLNSYITITGTIEL